MSKVVLFDIYNNNKPTLLRYLVQVKYESSRENDYSPYVINLLDDFLARYEGEFEGVFLTAWKYIVELILAAFWIIDKYIEDDHLFLTDILEIASTDITGKDILKAEVDIFSKCSNVGKYITERKFNYE